MAESSTNVETTTSTPSPYTLYPSDNSGALITPVLLRGDNYNEWATELSNSLQAKQKIGFIDGSIVKPTTQPNLSLWTSANSMIVGWIRTSIDPAIRSTVSHVPDAYKLWESIKLIFSVKSGVRRYLFENNITNCKQGSQSVIEYFGRLSKLWEKLQDLKTSRSCTCEAAEDIEKEHEDARVHKFLFRLDDSRFGSICSQIINEDLLPNLNSVISCVIRDEQHLHTVRSKEHSHEAVEFSVTVDPAPRTVLL